MENILSSKALWIRTAFHIAVVNPLYVGLDAYLRYIGKAFPSLSFDVLVLIASSLTYHVFVTRLMTGSWRRTFSTLLNFGVLVILIEYLLRF